MLIQSFEKIEGVKVEMLVPIITTREVKLERAVIAHLVSWTKSSK